MESALEAKVFWGPNPIELDNSKPKNPTHYQLGQMKLRAKLQPKLVKSYLPSRSAHFFYNL